MWVESCLPEVVVCGLRLGHLAVRLRLASVDDIGKLHSILNEEDGDIVSNNVPVTLLSVELDRESTNIADSVC